MREMDPVRYRTTRSQAALDAEDADVGAAHDVAGGFIPTAPTPIDPAVLRPFAADGARLRRGVLFDLDAGTEFVVQHPDDLAVAGRRHGLRPLAIHLAAGVVERLTDVRLGVREGVRNLAGRLVRVPPRWSSRQFCDPAGASPVVLIARSNT